MLERETELIKQIIVESTIDGREAIKLNDVIAAPLPRGVKAFMAAEVMKLLESDLAQSQKLSRITKGISATVTAERSLLRSLAMEYALEREEYLKLVEDTVHFLENYLCRPQWTLNQLMFEKDATISFESLVKKFDAVVDYSYFRMLVERHARRNGKNEITAEQFRNLIAKIDEEIVKQHSPRELALLTKPIFEFLLFGDASMTRPIPLGAILLFYEDKKMSGVKDYVERISQVRSHTQISLSELIGILEDLYHVETTVKKEVRESAEEILSQNNQTTQSQTDPVVTEPAVTLNNESPQVSNEENPETPIINRQSAESVRNEELPKVEVAELDTAELERDVPPLVIPTMPIANPNELSAFAKERQAQRFASFLTFPDRPTQEDLHAELPDIIEMLTKEQREKFVSRIFRDDENYFFIFLTSLNNAKTWRDAQPFLRDLFEMNKLNIRSPEVVEFTDAMQARYHPELRKAE